MRAVKKTWGREENHWEMWPGVPFICHHSQTLCWFLPWVLVLEKGYSFYHLPHGLCLRLLALYKNKVVTSTEPPMCEFGPAPVGLFLGSPVALSVHRSESQSLLPIRSPAMWEWCFLQGPITCLTSVMSQIVSPLKRYVEIQIPGT